MPEKTLLLDCAGYKVYAVDGAEIRKDFSVAFSGGDNWSHNRKIPKGEVWLEKSLKGSDRANILLHELVEAELMREFEMDYDEAHLVANTIESFVRKTDDLPTGMATLHEATGLPEESVKKITEAYTELQGTKEATVSSPAWLGIDPDQEVQVKTPARSGDVDPYEHYLSEALSSKRRRENLFDLASGTRWTGLRGIKERALTGLGEYSAMSSAGVSPGSKDFAQRMAGAVKKHFSDPGNVSKVFGSTLGPVEAIKTLGVKDLFSVHRLASDPLTWSQAFGKAAKTPAEQARARRILHAATSLYSAYKGVGIDKTKMELMWRGIPRAVQSKLKLKTSPRVTAGGTQLLPSVKDLAEQPSLNPEYFSDPYEAGQLMAKMSSADLERTKIAEELLGSYETATHKTDPEDHLYHVEKRDGKVVGMIKVAPKPEGNYHITNFWVRPGLRSQGIGSKLMKKVLELYGDKVLTLDSEIFDKSPLSQEQLDKFYEKFDFVKTEGLRMRREPNGAKEAAAAFARGAVKAVTPLVNTATQIGRGVTQAAKQRSFRPVRDTMDVLSGRAAHQLGWRQSYMNRLNYEIPQLAGKANRALGHLQNATDPRVQGHIRNNLASLRDQIDHSRFLGRHMGYGQNAGVAAYGRVDPRLKRFAHPGVAGAHDAPALPDFTA